MDLASVCALFATTYNPDPNERKRGELEIRKIAQEEGLINALLQIAGSEEVDLPTRQSCVLWVKNRVRSCYHLVQPKTAMLVPIPPSDKAAIKSSILHLLSISPNKLLQLQLAEILKNVVATDLPAGEWPEVIDAIKTLLVSNDIRQVHAGCLASLATVKAFALRIKTDMMFKIVEALFPSLVGIATGMMQQASQSADTVDTDIPEMLHLILKAYRSAIQLSLAPHLQTHQSIVPWGRLFFSLVTYQPQPAVSTLPPDERESHVWWKAKKWAYKTLGRLFNKYGNPSQLPSSLQDEYEKFAQNFVQEFAPEILRIYLGQVDLVVRGEAWLSDRCVCQIFNYFTECIKPKSTWAQLKPHFDSLVSTFVFPQLSFTEKKQQMWEDDPVDFIRVSVDEYEVYQSPVSAATSFLFSLAGNRTRTTFMPILGFINGVLRESPTASAKFGALNMTAALAPWIMKHPEVCNGMDGFLNQFVLPMYEEGQKAEGFLRYVGCEVMGSLIKYKMKFNTPDTLQKTLHAVLASLNDTEIPIRVQASLALVELVRRQGAELHAGLTPLVPSIIESLLKLMDETELELLNSCIELVVRRFGEELVGGGGGAVHQVVARLCETYTRYVNEILSSSGGEVTVGSAGDIILPTGDENGSGGAWGGEEEEDKTYSAGAILGTIGSVIDAVSDAPSLLRQIAEPVVSIIVYTLEKRALDLFDNVYDLVDSLTFKMKVIEPGMWRVFEETYAAFKQGAVDFLDEMLPALDNFVSYGGDVFKARPEYRQMVLDVYTTSLTSPHLGDNDKVNGSKIAESILLNLRGGADDCLQPILLSAVDLMDKEETKSLALANLEVIVNAILYNPPVSLGIMEATRPGSAHKFFDKWIATIHHGSTPRGLPRVHDKRLTLVTLCSLLEMDPTGIPDGLRSGWPGLVGAALIVFRDYPKAVDLRKQAMDDLENEADDDDDDDLDDSVLNMNEEEEDVWDENSAYLELLANESTRQRARLERQDTGQALEEDDSDEEDEDQFAEDLGFFTPLDKVDPYVQFKGAMHTFQMKNPTLYDNAMASLQPSDQALIMEIVRIADTNATIANSVA